MFIGRTGRQATATVLSVFLGFCVVLTARPAEAQFIKQLPIPSIPGTKGKPGSKTPSITGLSGLVGCAGGATVAVMIAKVMAEAEGKRLKLTPDQTAQRAHSYELGLAMGGCGSGAVLSGTAFAKMSEKGKKDRDQQLQLAAADATPRTYKDPDNPSLEGHITPEPTFVEANKECRTMEDSLADEGKGETAYVKYCKQADGKWAQEKSAPTTAGAGN